MGLFQYYPNGGGVAGMREERKEGGAREATCLFFCLFACFKLKKATTRTMDGDRISTAYDDDSDDIHTRARALRQSEA